MHPGEVDLAPSPATMSREQFVEILNLWKRSLSKRAERRIKEEQKGNMKMDLIEKPLGGPDSNYFKDPFFNQLGRKNLSYSLVHEFKTLKMTEMDFTMRTDELREVEKRVDSILVKHANKHQAEFMEGMQLLEGISIDLNTSLEICGTTRNTFGKMKRDIVLRSARVILMARRK